MRKLYPISSLNVRGLDNNEKRRKIFQWLRKKKFSIYMLQEVHCAERSFKTWAAEWGYKAFFSGLASNKAGVAILFNNNFTFKVLRPICNKEWRYIIIDLEVGELILTICNIYAPNLVVDVTKDKKGGKLTTHRNSLEVIQNIRDNLDLTDIWGATIMQIKAKDGANLSNDSDILFNFYSGKSLSACLQQITLILALSH